MIHTRSFAQPAGASLLLQWAQTQIHAACLLIFTYCGSTASSHTRSEPAIRQMATIMRRPSKTKTSQQLQPAQRQPSDVTAVSTDIAAQARHPTPMETEVPARRIVPPILNQPSWRPSRLGSGFAFPFSLAAARQILRGCAIGAWACWAPDI
ncbi:hypothetical protein HDV57DRAFT_488665 [Trichoderma longibrachiatum]